MEGGLLFFFAFPPNIEFCFDLQQQDLAECGCWRGGVGAVMAAVLLSAGELRRAPAPPSSVSSSSGGSFNVQAQSNGAVSEAEKEEGAGAAATIPTGPGRTVWLFDSFEGLPSINPKAFPADSAHAGDVGAANEAVLGDNSMGAVRESLERLGVFDRWGTKLVRGFFEHSLPNLLRRGGGGGGRSGGSGADGSRGDDGGGSSAGSGSGGKGGGGPFKQLALLRVDGDLYESTIQALHYLYPSLAVGGHVVVDDFTDWVGCRRATRDFRLVHGIGPSATGSRNRGAGGGGGGGSSGGGRENTGESSEALQVVWHDVARGEQVRGVWWTKHSHVSYDPLDTAFLAPEDYAAAAEAIRNKRQAK
jgi:hypothetical protein